MGVMINVPDDLARQMETYVDDGLFASSADVVAAAMNSLADQMAYQRLKDDIAEGLADVEAGRVGPLDLQAIKQEGRALLAARQGR